MNGKRSLTDEQAEQWRKNLLWLSRRISPHYDRQLYTIYTTQQRISAAALPEQITQSPRLSSWLNHITNPDTVAAPPNPQILEFPVSYIPNLALPLHAVQSTRDNEEQELRSYSIPVDIS